LRCNSKKKGHQAQHTRECEARTSHTGFLVVVQFQKAITFYGCSIKGCGTSSVRSILLNLSFSSFNTARSELN